MANRNRTESFDKLEMDEDFDSELELDDDTQDLDQDELTAGQLELDEDYYEDGPCGSSWGNAGPNMWYDEETGEYYSNDYLDNLYANDFNGMDDDTDYWDEDEELEENRKTDKYMLKLDENRHVLYPSLIDKLENIAYEFLSENLLAEETEVYIDTYPNEKYPEYVTIEVRAELHYRDLVNLAEELNRVITEYDPDAYFEPDQPGILTAFVNKQCL